MNKSVKIFILVFISMPLLVFSQENIDRYFDDGGYSTIKNEISIDALHLFDFAIDINYERYLNRKTSLNIAYLYQSNNYIANNFALVLSIFNAKNGDFKFAPYRAYIANAITHEISLGAIIYPRNNRLVFMKLLGGYNYMINAEDFQKTIFMQWTPGVKIINTPRFMTAISTQIRANVFSSNIKKAGADILFGVNLFMGVKF